MFEQMNDFLAGLNIFELDRLGNTGYFPFSYWKLKNTKFYFVVRARGNVWRRNPYHDSPPASNDNNVPFETVLEGVNQEIRSVLLFHLDVFNR